MDINNFEVAMGNFVCPVCGKTVESTIIMNTKLTQKAANAVKEAHNKSIGYADKLCESCEAYKDAVVFFISIDPEKSTPSNPYRTGNVSGVKKDAELSKQILKDKLTVKIAGADIAFTDETFGKEIGLW